jgi:murein DD-endopeptidase MepM/ murein hydrolase activator NlpD
MSSTGTGRKTAARRLRGPSGTMCGINHLEGVTMNRIGFVVVAALAVIAVAVFSFWWTSGPAVSLAPDSGVIGIRTLTVKAEGARGLKSLTATAVQGGKRVPVLAKSWPGKPRTATETFDLSAAGLKDGPLTLEVAAAGSPVLGLPGRTSASQHSFTLDATPPVVTILSTAHNIIRGGAGVVVYTVSKEVGKTGVVFGDRFVPAYRQEGGRYISLFPFPWDAQPERYVPKVLAVDKAGNERLATINYHLIIKPFSTDTIVLTDKLLDKIAGDFKNRFPQAKTPLDIFLKANGELREENRKALYEFAKQTSPTPLWEGIFLRMPNTAPLGGFAQTRTYLYGGAKVDQQTHLGFDLASVAQAPVPAANRGKVVYAGDLGIYGQCVVIDHGLGLQTLYAHLSRIAVKPGDMVAKGQEIGNTGATGMAAGDHLHFGVTVAGQEVNPVEWWDAHWIRDNVAGKLAAGKSPAGK